MSNPEPEFIDPNQIRPGPIRHKTLPPDLLELIQAVYQVIGPYLGTTLEQFEIGFMRDAHPESEVAIWCSIASAWIDYHERYLNDEVLSDEEERKLVAALLLISMGVNDVEKLDVSAVVGERLLECYDGLGEEREGEVEGEEGETD